MNLCIHFKERCVTSLDLLQQRLYKGHLNVSEGSTVVRPQQTALENTPAASCFLQQMAKMRLAQEFKEFEGLALLRPSLWCHWSVFGG